MMEDEHKPGGEDRDPRDETIAQLRDQLVEVTRDCAEQTRIALAAGEARADLRDQLAGLREQVKAAEKARADAQAEVGHLQRQIERARGWIDRVLEEQEVGPRYVQQELPARERGPRFHDIGRDNGFGGRRWS
ncbi:hypothetical protein [Sphingomonas aquatilis]